jgi:hypothetical protein
MGGTGMAGDSGIDAGLLLVGSAIGDPLEYSLIALSPERGIELSRESSNRVAAVAYDSARDETDVWYVFFADDKASAVNLGTLSVRHYDEANGEFVELANLMGVPVPNNPDIAVLNHRLFYHSTVPGSPPKSGFTLIDTTNLEDPKIVGMLQGPDQDSLQGILAHPSGTSDGGSVTLITQDPASCTADADPAAAAGDKLCPVLARRATISASSTTASISSTTVEVGQIAVRSTILGLGGWTTGVVGNGPRDVYVFPPATIAAGTTGRVSVRELGMFNEDATAAFAIAGRRIPAVGLDPCRQLVLATELDSKNLFVITTSDLGKGTIKAGLGHVGGRVLYDEYSRTVFTLFQDSSSPAIDAWTLGGTGTAPSLTARKASGANKWAPGARINPTVGAIKSTPDGHCD